MVLLQISEVGGNKPVHPYNLLGFGNNFNEIIELAHICGTCQYFF